MLSVSIAVNAIPGVFPGAVTERGAISAGDYALMDGDKMLAVVERKILDNLLADFGIMPVLHQRLAELATYGNHALGLEAPYADFLDHKKVQLLYQSDCRALRLHSPIFF